MKRPMPSMELEEEWSSRGARFYVSDDLDEETRAAFLRHVLAFEKEPKTTVREYLAAQGKEVQKELWPLIAQLAGLNIVIGRTDHLDDAALLRRLLRFVDKPTQLSHDTDTITHLGLLGGASEDLAICLRYYASDEDREQWRRDFPADVIPPRERPPFDRDRLLPSAEDLRAPRATTRDPST